MDCRSVLHSEQPQVNLLRELSGVEVLAKAPVNELLQRPAVRRKQSFHQISLFVSHAANIVGAGIIAVLISRVARRALGHL